MHYIFFFIFYTCGENLLPSKAGKLLPEEVVGGSDVGLGLRGYQVAVKGRNERICGGGVLNDWLVASAAQCLINYQLSRFYYKSFKVVVTSNLLQRDHTINSVLVQKVYLPPSFNVSSFARKTTFEAYEDFVVLKLKRELGIVFIPALRELSLYPIRLYQRDTYTVAGYGVHALTEDGQQMAIDGQLRVAEVELISNEICSTIYQYYVPEFLLCGRVVQFPGITRGMCTGDAGSPLVLNDMVIIGVLVYHSETCSDGIFPSIYMRISYYAGMIENINIGNTSSLKVFSINKSNSKFRFEESL